MDLSIYRESLPADFSAAYRSTLPNMTRHHLHEQFEMVLLPTGRGQFFLNDRQYALEPGSLVLLGNMDLHHFSFRSEAEAGRYVLFFRPEYADTFSSPQCSLLSCFFFRPFPDPQLLRLDAGQARAVAERMERLVRMETEPDAWGKPLSRQLELAQLLIEVNRLYQDAHGMAGGVENEKFARVFRLIHYIHRNLTEDLSLGALSARFFLNKNYLCTLFRQVTGQTPAQYILGCRIMKAKELLSAGRSVEAACSGAGFRNLAHFSQTFKQNTGFSPKKYAAQASCSGPPPRLLR